jgi:hypothetical protein
MKVETMVPYKSKYIKETNSEFKTGHKDTLASLLVLFICRNREENGLQKLVGLGCSMTRYLFYLHVLGFRGDSFIVQL